MIADLLVKDVCGLRNEHKYTIQSGKLSYIKGNNASGKSSIIKALIAILSTPKEGVFEKYQREAQNLGIQSEELSAHDNFVNIYGNAAKVKLKFEENEYNYEVKSTGEIISAPNGNENFLLTGAVTNNARVIQQLSSGNNESEFGWLIDEMSLADNYELMAQIIQDKIDEIEMKKASIKNRIEHTQDYSDEHNKNLKILKKLGEEKKLLMKDLNKDEAERREKLEKDIDRISEELKYFQKAMTTQKMSIEKKENAISKTKKELKKINEQIGQIEDSQISDDFERFKVLAQDKMVNLKEEKSKVDGLLNIYQSAQQKMFSEKLEAVKCFLCSNGELNKHAIDEKIRSVIQEKKSIEKEIYEVNTNLFNYQGKIKQQEERYKDLMKKQKEYRGYVKDAEYDLIDPKGKYGGLKSHLDEKELELKNVNEVYTELIDEGQNALSVKEKKIVKEIRDLEGRQYEISKKILELTGNEEIFNSEYSLEKALKIYDGWMDYLTSAKDYSSLMYKKFREEARNIFNKNIDLLMKDIGFKGFKGIWINEKGRLMVERDSEEEMAQPVGSLSLSEKYAIGMLLQLSVKEAYLPNIPFFIVDDVLQDFDDSKKAVIEDYLDNLAKEKNMFVMISMLDKNIESVIID